MATKRDLSDLTKYLILVGFWSYSGDSSNRIRRWFQIFRVLFFAQAVSLWVISAYIIGMAQLLGKVYAGITLSTPYMLIQTIYIFCNSHHLQAFVTMMAATVAKRKEQWEKDIFSSLLDPLWKIIRFVAVYCLLQLGMAFGGPILYDTIVTIFTDAQPLNLDVSNEGLLPSEKDRKVLYYLLRWYNAFLEGFCSSHFIGLVTILPLMVNYIRVEIKILCRKIDEFSRKEDSKQEVLLREIIEDHVNIMRLTELLNKLLAAPLILQNITAPASLTLFIYAMNKAFYEGNDTISVLLFKLTSPFSMMLVIFLYCYAGDLLHSESSNIYDGFCQINWYNMPKKRQKDILIILNQVQRPLQIQYKGNSIDLRAFQQVTNTTYSCFMLLKSFA